MEISMRKPSRESLDNMIQAIDKQMNLEKLNMYEVAWEIYERTYYKYAIQTNEERMLREKYEQKVVEKSTKLREADELLGFVLGALGEGAEGAKDVAVEAIESYFKDKTDGK